MHSYFMRPVDIGSSVRYEVERLRDGRGLLHPHGPRLPERQARLCGHGFLPGSGGRSGLPARGPAAGRAGIAADGGGSAGRRRRRRRGLLVRGPQLRHAACSRSGIHRASRGSRCRSRPSGSRPSTALPDDADLHRAALAYVCDYTILEPLLRVTDSTGPARDSPPPAWTTPCGSTATAGWTTGCSTSRKPFPARATAAWRMGHFFDRQGRLLATVAQEGMIRAGARKQPFWTATTADSELQRRSTPINDERKRP